KQMMINGKMIHQAGTASRKLSASRFLFIFLAFVLLSGILPPYQAVKADPYLEQECSSYQEGWLFCDDFEQDQSDSYHTFTDTTSIYREPSKGLFDSTALTLDFQGTNPRPGNISLAFGKTPNTASYKP